MINKLCISFGYCRIKYSIELCSCFFTNQKGQGSEFVGCDSLKNCMNRKLIESWSKSWIVRFITNFIPRIYRLFQFCMNHIVSCKILTAMVPILNYLCKYLHLFHQYFIEWTKSQNHILNYVLLFKYGILLRFTDISWDGSHRATS